MEYNPLLNNQPIDKKLQQKLSHEQFMTFLSTPNFSYLTVLEKLSNTLVLDISKSGTGVAIWKDNQLTLDTWSFTEYDDIRDIKKAFRQKLLETFEGNPFNHVIIEQTIGSVNYKTASLLYQLNPIVDDLMDMGYIEERPIHRRDSNTWRMYLKAVSQYKSPIVAPTDVKALTQECLVQLGVPAVWRNDNESDALGMLIGIGVVDILGYTTEQKKVTKHTNILKGFTILQFFDNPVEDMNIKLPKEIINETIIYKDVTGQNTDVMRKSKELLLQYGDDNVFCIKIDSYMIGVLTVEKKDIAFTNNPCYLVFYHKKSIKDKYK